MREYQVVKYQENLWALITGNFGRVLINKKGDMMQLGYDFDDELIIVDKKTVHPFLLKDFDLHVSKIFQIQGMA